MSIGDNLRKLRGLKGFSRRSLSEESGVKETWLVDVELGNVDSPGVKNLQRVANVLGVSIIELVCGEDADQHEIRFSLDPKANLSKEDYASAKRIMEGVLRELESKKRREQGKK